MTAKEERVPSLPRGWTWVRVGEVVDKVSTTGRKIKRRDYLSRGRIPVVDQGQAFIGGFTDREDMSLLCQPPVIVFGDHTRAVKFIDFQFAAGADGIKVIKPWGVLDAKMLYYLLQNVPVSPKGYARHFQFVEKALIPIPPVPEQRRIVAKIEELFAKLDGGIEALKTAKAQLRRYRQAVLKSAFEGRLTKEWRESHRDELDSVYVPQQRAMAVEEKDGERIRGKEEEISPLAVAALRELPGHWLCGIVGDIGEVIQYGTSEKAVGGSSGVPVIRMGNIQDGKLVFEDLKYFPRDWPQLSSFLLQDGDILFNRTNSSELVGKTAVYKEAHPKAVFASYLIRVKVKREAYDPDVLCFFISSLYGRRYISSVVSQQVGQANVSGSKLRSMPVPLIPLAEQRVLAHEIQRRFSVADGTEMTIEENLGRAERLKQSILKKAFEGTLVPQDPSDEPAEKLLARIRQEKAKRQAESKAKKKHAKLKAQKRRRRSSAE